MLRFILLLCSALPSQSLRTATSRATPVLGKCCVRAQSSYTQKVQRVEKVLDANANDMRNFRSDLNAKAYEEAERLVKGLLVKGSRTALFTVYQEAIRLYPEQPELVKAYQAEIDGQVKQILNFEHPTLKLNTQSLLQLLFRDSQHLKSWEKCVLYDTDHDAELKSNEFSIRAIFGSQYIFRKLRNPAKGVTNPYLGATTPAELQWPHMSFTDVVVAYFVGHCNSSPFSIVTSIVTWEQQCPSN